MEKRKLLKRAGALLCALVACLLCACTFVAPAKALSYTSSSVTGWADWPFQLGFTTDNGSYSIPMLNEFNGSALPSNIPYYDEAGNLIARIELMGFANGDLGYMVSFGEDDSGRADSIDLSFTGISWHEVSDSFRIGILDESARVTCYWTGYYVDSVIGAEVVNQTATPVTGEYTQVVDYDNPLFFTFLDHIAYNTIITHFSVRFDFGDNPIGESTLYFMTGTQDANSMSARARYLADLLDVVYTYVPPEGPETPVDVDFTSWITEAVSGFWAFELIPGITIEGIVYSLLGVGFLIMVLKYFAGG